MLKASTGILALLTGILGTALLLSCQGSLFFSEYQPIPHRQWDCADTLEFRLPVADTDTDLSLTVGVRSDYTFDCEKVVVKVEQRIGKRTVATDTLHVVFYADNGKGTGVGFPIADNYSSPKPFHLKAGKSYTLRLSHLMRQNPLNGSPSVGIFLEK